MKKFRKLIPAFAMLLVSAVMLGTSTFAWFSMNDKVTASGMNVTATANTQFLVISKTNSLDGASTSITDLTATDTTNTGKVYPCAQATAANNPVEGIAIGDWYTANSKSYSDAGAIGGSNFINAKKITDLKNYHIVYEFYLGLASGNNDTYTGPIKIDNSGTMTAGACALVQIGEQSHTFKNGDTTWTTSDVTLNTTSPVKVTVTLYIDGNDSNVKNTTGASSITGALDLTITATGISGS